MLDRVARLNQPTRHRLRTFLEAARFEVLPLPDVVRRAEPLVEGAEVAVTADPEKGMGATVGASVALAGSGYRPVPHLSARLMRDRAEVDETLASLTAAGVDRVLVVGGVADSPGPYLDAGSLMDVVGTGAFDIGIAGYPEGHHGLSDDVVEKAIRDKAPAASWITTQICFSPRRIEAWLRRLRSDGVALPVWLGVPAVADLTGMMSLGLKVGPGRSLRFLFEHPRLVSRLLRPGGRAATRLVSQLAHLATDPTLGIAGFHVFTYHQVAAADRWRRGLLRKLERSL